MSVSTLTICLLCVVGVIMTMLVLATCKIGSLMQRFHELIFRIDALETEITTLKYQMFNALHHSPGRRPNPTAGAPQPSPGGMNVTELELQLLQRRGVLSKVVKKPEPKKERRMRLFRIGGSDAE